MGVSATTLDVERVSVERPTSTIAASFLRRPCGGYRLTVNDALMAQPGAREWAELWFRLRARTQGHTYGILLADDLALYAPYVVGHRYATN